MWPITGSADAMFVPASSPAVRSLPKVCLRQSCTKCPMAWTCAGPIRWVRPSRPVRRVICRCCIAAQRRPRSAARIRHDPASAQTAALRGRGDRGCACLAATRTKIRSEHRDFGSAPAESAARDHEYSARDGVAEHRRRVWHSCRRKPLACGCPVIASTNTGGEDLFTDGAEGFIVPIRSPDAIAQRLQQLADDPALQVTMRAAALRRVQALGGWDQYGQNILTVVEDLVHG